jgi:hypothetical protein
VRMALYDLWLSGRKRGQTVATRGNLLDLGYHGLRQRDQRLPNAGDRNTVVVGACVDGAYVAVVDKDDEVGARRGGIVGGLAHAVERLAYLARFWSTERLALGHHRSDGPEISDCGIADVKTLRLPVGEIAPLFRTGERGLTRVNTASDYALDLRGSD